MTEVAQGYDYIAAPPELQDIAPTYDYRHLTVELRRALAGSNLNSINYASDLADYWLTPEQQRERSWEMQQAEVSVNLYTAAVEVPLSMVGKPYNYDLYQREGQNLYTTNGFSLGTQLVETIANASGQTPEWDIKRAEYDLQNYNLLNAKLARMQPGEQATFIELSPTPQTSAQISDSQAAERGYWGSDSVRVHQLQVSEDEAGNITHKTNVTALWLPGRQLASWVELNGAQLDHNEQSQRLDLQVMSLSGFLDAGKVAELQQLAQEYAAEFEAMHPQLEAYLNTHIRPDVQSWVESDLGRSAKQLAAALFTRGADAGNANLAKRLSMLTAHKIAGWQVELRQAIEQAISGKLDLSKRSSFAQLNAAEQKEYLFNHREEILACGGIMKFEGGATGDWKIVPAGIYAGSILTLLSELEDYNCGGCGRLITIPEFIDDPSVPVKCFCGHTNDC